MTFTERALLMEAIVAVICFAAIGFMLGVSFP